MDPQHCTRLHLNVDLAPGRKLFRFADLITAFPKLGKCFRFFLLSDVKKNSFLINDHVRPVVSNLFVSGSSFIVIADPRASLLKV
jgi:hypothetical protein